MALTNDRLQVPGSQPTTTTTSCPITNPSSPTTPNDPSTVKRRIEVKSAKQYADDVTAHADSKIGYSLYSGQNYVSLSEYLQKPYRPDSSINVSVDNEPEANFITLHDLNLPEEHPCRIQQFGAIDDFVKACEDKHRQAKPGLLLFIRGHPSPEWLSTIGWICNVDPEFFLRHLDFRSSSTEMSYFTVPALPSSTSNIMRLRLPSIGYRQFDRAIDQKEVEYLRKTAASTMRDYMLELKRENGVKTGDSIVRSFAVHDQEHYTLEQDVSICVNDFGKGWIGIIWLDHGHDLMEGPNGPWSSSMIRSHSWKTSMNPTILHRPGIALKTAYITPRHSHQHHRVGKFPQSASSIHTHYGRFLRQETSVADPFYALSEMFLFAATSETQFLNMVEQKIVSEMSKSVEADDNNGEGEGVYSWTVSNLLYNKNILDQHIRRLKENIISIKNGGGPKWPKANDEKQRQTAKVASDALLDDFSYLLERAKTLSETCDRGINIAGNNAMVAESHTAYQQARRVSKLTLLAFLFVPASFTTSLFGMNFEQFGQGSLNIWVWIVVLLLTYIVALLLLSFDISNILRYLWRSLRSK